MPLPRTTEAPPRIQIQAIEPIVDCGRYASSARSVTGSMSTRRSSRTGTTCSAALSASAGRASAAGARCRSRPLGNDRFGGHVHGRRPGRWQFAVAAWSDRIATWQDELRRKVAPGRRSSPASSPRELRCSGASASTVEEGLAVASTRPARRSRLGAARGRRRPCARAFRLVVRALPALVRGVPWRCGGATAARRARLRRRLPAADPPDRHDEPEGPEQHARRRGRTTGLAVGDRLGGRAATSDRSGARDVGRLRRDGRRREGGRGRAGARLRDPVLARPPVAEGASGVVQPAPGRDAEVRREPAEALPGHLQRQLRLRGLAWPLAGAARRRDRLGRARHHGLPGRQSPHEAVAVLGVADPGGALASIPRCCSSPRRSPARH